MLGYSRHEKAVERIRHFCEGKRTLAAFSGGKDSQCCYHLCEEAGIDFSAQYSVTRFEPPELLDFIREHYPKVTFRRAYSRSLIDEIEYRGVPTRWARWCCDAKHKKTDGFDVSVIGIRWGESASRRDTWRMTGFKPDKTFYVCPIIEWTDEDVWEYLGDLPHCPLYDEGYKRIGCVMCPLVPQKMAQEAVRWPKTAAMLRKGADAYVSRLRNQGFLTKRGCQVPDWCLSENAELEHWNRWVFTGQTAKPIDLVSDSESDLCLFAGTGFDEADGFDENEAELGYL